LAIVDHQHHQQIHQQHYLFLIHHLNRNQINYQIQQIDYNCYFQVKIKQLAERYKFTSYDLFVPINNNNNNNSNSNSNNDSNNDTKKLYDSVFDIYNILVPYYHRHFRKGINTTDHHDTDNGTNDNNDNNEKDEKDDNINLDEMLKNNPNILFPQYVITDRKIELNEIIGLFCGTPVRRLYEITLIIFGLGINWGYTTVFGTALVVIFGINGVSNSCQLTTSGIENVCEHLYWIYVSIYAGIVISLSMLNFGEQKYFQITLTILRFILIAIVVSTSILLIYSDYKPAGDGKFEYDHNVKKPHYGANLTMFNPNGIFPFIAVCAFASVFHQGIPSISQPIKDKENLVYVFLAACSTCFVLYSIFSVSVIFYFGSDVEAPASLNWASFPGFNKGDQNSVWAKVIGHLVVLFPALDVCSTFPLNTITLTNNISFALFGLSADDPKIKFAFKGIIIRLLLCIVPLIGGFFIPNFDMVLQFTGCIGLIVSFIFPSLIEFKSKQLCQQIFRSKDNKTFWTQYTKWYCHGTPVICIFLFGTGVVILALYYAIVSVAP